MPPAAPVEPPTPAVDPVADPDGVEPPVVIPPVLETPAVDPVEVLIPGVLMPVVVEEVEEPVPAVEADEPMLPVVPMLPLEVEDSMPVVEPVVVPPVVLSPEAVDPVVPAESGVVVEGEVVLAPVDDIESLDEAVDPVVVDGPAVPVAAESSLDPLPQPMAKAASAARVLILNVVFMVLSVLRPRGRPYGKDLAPLGFAQKERKAALGRIQWSRNAVSVRRSSRGVHAAHA